MRLDGSKIDDDRRGRAAVVEPGRVLPIPQEPADRRRRAQCAERRPDRARPGRHRRQRRSLGSRLDVRIGLRDNIPRAAEATRAPASRRKCPFPRQGTFASAPEFVSTGATVFDRRGYRWPMAPEAPRLLFVHAHPDDETINNGATIAHYVGRVAHGAGGHLHPGRGGAR